MSHSRWVGPKPGRLILKKEMVLHLSGNDEVLKGNGTSRGDYKESIELVGFFSFHFKTGQLLIC